MTEKVNKKPLNSDRIFSIAIVLIIIFLIGYNAINFFGPTIMLNGKEVLTISGKEPSTGIERVIQINKEKSILIFWATWCSTCIDEIEMLKKIKTDVQITGILKMPVKVEQLSKIAPSFYSIIGTDPLHDDFMISAVPTIILLKNNKIEKVKVGMISEQEFKNWLEQ